MKTDAIRRLTAAALTLCILLGLTLPASASWALGTELAERSTQLAGGVTLTAQNLWSASRSDLRSEHYITYTPGGGVTPMVYSGAYVTSTSTLSAAASAMQSQGYRVVGGINGGFFNTDGTAVGALMTEGAVRTLDVLNYVKVGFTGDGQVFIDELEPAKTASWQTTAIQDPDPSSPDGPEEGVPVVTPHKFALSGFNAYRNKIALGGLYLYNRDFNSRVNKDPNWNCVAVTLTPAPGGEMTMDCSLTFAVAGMCDTAAGDVFNGVLDEGEYMLYANESGGNDVLLSALRALRPGDLVTITVGGASERWKDAEYGLSGLYPLLWGGEIAPGLPDAVNPYTAIGIKADGSAVFYTIDGRQSGWSVGATYAQVAQRLQELGCVSAVALDGGGSTSLGATLPGSSSFTVVNRPSGGGERRVNNCVLLLSPAGSPILDGGYYPTAGTQVVLAGANLDLTAVPYDPTGGPGEGADPSWSATGGVISGSGLSAVYTAGPADGTYQITTLGGSLPVRVTSALSSLTVRREDSASPLSSLTLAPGDSANLTASGRWYNLPVAMADENVIWQADAGLGTIDGQGRFTAGQNSVSGAVTASAGGKTVTIQVTVTTGLPFDDVHAGDWFLGAVRYAVEHRLMNGISSTQFAPYSPATRGMIMTILARRAGADTSGGSPWYQPGMDWAVASGVSDGTYPEANITREQLATMLWRHMGRPAADLSRLDGFSDGGSVSSWARDAMAWAVEKAIFQGDGANLDPLDFTTRAEAAAVLTRFCQQFPG